MLESSINEIGIAIAFSLFFFAMVVAYVVGGVLEACPSKSVEQIQKEMDEYQERRKRWCKSDK